MFSRAIARAAVAALSVLAAACAPSRPPRVAFGDVCAMTVDSPRVDRIRCWRGDALPVLHADSSGLLLEGSAIIEGRTTADAFGFPRTAAPLDAFLLRLDDQDTPRWLARLPDDLHFGLAPDGRGGAILAHSERGGPSKVPRPTPQWTFIDATGQMTSRRLDGFPGYVRSVRFDRSRGLLVHGSMEGGREAVFALRPGAATATALTPEEPGYHIANYAQGTPPSFSLDAAGSVYVLTARPWMRDHVLVRVSAGVEIWRAPMPEAFGLVEAPDGVVVLSNAMPPECPDRTSTRRGGMKVTRFEASGRVRFARCAPPAFTLHTALATPSRLVLAGDQFASDAELGTPATSWCATVWTLDDRGRTIETWHFADQRDDAAQSHATSLAIRADGALSVAGNVGSSLNQRIFVAHARIP